MRLIDADALLKALHNYFDGKVIDEPTYILRDVYCYIGAAQTVVINCKDCDGYEAGYSAGLKDAERPQGEWITKNIERPYGKCNQCGEICEIDNYCGNCGAQMVKGGVE